MKRMNRRIFIIITATVFTMSLGMTGCASKTQNPDREVISETEGEKNPVEENDKELLPILTDDAVTYLQDFDSLSVRLVEMSSIAGEEGKVNSTYDRYIMSDVDLTSGEELSEDYSNALEKDSVNDSMVKLTTFEEVFGFDFRDCRDVYEVYRKAIDAYGIDADLGEAEYDEELFQALGQKSYVLKNHVPLETKIMQGILYDELMESYCTYQVWEPCEGMMIPESFSVIVRYEKDHVIYTKTAYLELEIFSSKAEENAACACGNLDMSDCDEACQQACLEKLSEEISE